MGTITLKNVRATSDLTVKVRLKDGGTAISWPSLSNIKAWLYSDAQKAISGRFEVSVDEGDATILVCHYSAQKPQYLGLNRVIVQATYLEDLKTYDKPAFIFVRWTDDQTQDITIDDPDVDVEIEVQDVSSSILDAAIAAAVTAAVRAEEAAAAAEHMVDIHQGPPGEDGKSPYIGENGHWYEWDEDAGEYVDTETEAQGETGTTPDITIGTVTTAEPGTPAAATMTGTPEAPVLNLTIPKGVAGDTPAFTVGEVTTGQPGTPVVVTITGTAAAPVLNVTIPQGLQGNTGSSVEYPYELVNNLTTNDATKGLSAAQGKVLKDELTQLEAKVDGFDVNVGTWSVGSVNNPSNGHIPNYSSNRRLRTAELTIQQTEKYLFRINSGYKFGLIVVGKRTSLIWDSELSIDLEQGDIYRIVLREDPDPTNTNIYQNYTQSQIDALVSASGFRMFVKSSFDKLKEELEEEMDASLSMVEFEADLGLSLHELSNTEVNGLMINGTNDEFASAGSTYSVYYIPVSIGDIIVFTANNETAQVLKYGFSESIPANGVPVIGGTRLEGDSAQVKVISTINGYFAIYHNVAYFNDGKFYFAEKSQFSQELDEYLDEYFDFYSKNIKKEIAIVGVGSSGTVAGVKQIGDIFYNTTTDLLRKAISQASGGTFNYETVPPENDAVYVSPVSQYQYIENVFTEIDPTSLGLLGKINKNAKDIENLSKRHLKICLLGNSYTADCWRYVPFMLLRYGVTCELYFYYRGSGSLNDLNSQWEDYGTTGTAETDGANHSRLCAHIDSRTDSKWVIYPSVTENGVTRLTMCAKDIVEVGNNIGGWDLVTLQQVSTFTDIDPDNDPDGRYEHLTDIIDYIQEHCNEPFSLAWFQSYTRASHDSATIRENSLINQAKVYEQWPFSLEIPVATAVFSCRNNPVLAEIGDSSYHNLWASDDIHLQDGLPCYIGSLVVAQAILNYFGLGKSVLNDQFRATTENVGQGKIGLDTTAQYPCVGVTESNCRLAQKSAVEAIKRPNEISEI